MAIYTTNNKIWTLDNKWVNKPDPVDPYNPLGLPPNTVRVRTSDGNVPLTTYHASYETATLVPGTSDVYDVYKSGTSFTSLLLHSTNVVEVLGANTSNVIYMREMFSDCTSLTNVALFDTSNVTDMQNMFGSCFKLTSIPLFNTSSATNMNYTFQMCSKVESGALAIYQQASSQANPPSSHDYTFMNCGSNTTTGAAELAQIPSSWGGDGE